MGWTTHLELAPRAGARRRGVLAAGLVAVAALAVAGGVASAQQARNLRLVTPAGEKADAVFAVHTAAVQAKFDYSDADQTSIGLVVYGPGGLRLLRKDATYSGTGTATIDLSGPALYRGLTAGLVSDTDEIQRAASQASSAQRGTREYLNGVQAGLLLIRSALKLVHWNDLPPAADERIAQLRQAMDDLDALMQRSNNLDDSDDAGRRNLAAKMATPAADAVAAAQGLDAGAAALTDIEIMPTGDNSPGGDGYLLEALIDSIPAASTHMWVKTPPQAVYLPYAQQRR
jgi:hypothetical protein